MKENKKGQSQASPIRAAEVLDAPEQAWRERPWWTRREAGPEEAPFCDVAASQILARLARMGAEQPVSQRFLSGPGLDAWSAEFGWGRAWCASRGGEFWAWAQGDGVSDARVEVAGSVGMWDEDLADAFAQSLAAGPVDKPW